MSSRGIELNPEKVEAIDRMQLPTRLKEAQCLTGWMVALGRFISKLRERGLPLFKHLKKAGGFEWTVEADQAFRGLKEYLSSPLVLMAPHDKDELLLYISATPQVVSAVLVVEREEEDPGDGSPDLGRGEPRGATEGPPTPDPRIIPHGPLRRPRCVQHPV
jgi:hypothetical protein